MGVGKSVTARNLGQLLGWCVLDKDDASDVLLGNLEPHGKYAYEILFAYAESLLMQGFSVIVDSPLRGDIGYLRASRFSSDKEVDLRVLELFCSDQKEHARRLETRDRRKAHVIKTWRDFDTYWETSKSDFDYPVRHPVLKLDTLSPVRENLDLILTWLEITS